MIHAPLSTDLMPFSVVVKKKNVYMYICLILSMVILTTIVKHIPRSIDLLFRNVHVTWKLLLLALRAKEKKKTAARILQWSNVLGLQIGKNNICVIGNGFVWG